MPGGYVETGETPAQAAAREVREELGIEVPIGPLLVADWAPHPDEGDKLLRTSLSRRIAAFTGPTVLP